MSTLSRNYIVDRAAPRPPQRAGGVPRNFSFQEASRIALEGLFKDASRALQAVEGQNSSDSSFWDGGLLEQRARRIPRVGLVVTVPTLLRVPFEEISIQGLPRTLEVFFMASARVLQAHNSSMAISGVLAFSTN